LTACVLDTDVVIAALDRRDRHYRQAANAVTAMLEADDSLLLSLVTYAEALVRPAEDSRALETAVDAIAARPPRNVRTRARATGSPSLSTGHRDFADLVASLSYQ
jgi:predicted nucleic acid-binding protein